jgi:hypothetical protein
MSNCLANQDDGGAKLGDDELAHVVCRYGNVFVHFEQYKSPLDRDRAREFRQRLNTENRSVAPGMAEPSRKARTSDPAVGTYLEYAVQQTSGDKADAVKFSTTGIWWDGEDDKATAVLIEANWDVLGKSWEPLRDLWQRHS